MIDSDLQDPQDPQDPQWTEGKLLAETAQCVFADLARAFAKGQLIEVQAALDLVDVAAAFNRDDLSRFEVWTRDLAVMRVSDERAKDWVARDPALWAVVVAPWVLVQERPKPAS